MYYSLVNSSVSLSLLDINSFTNSFTKNTWLLVDIEFFFSFLFFSLISPWHQFIHHWLHFKILREINDTSVRLFIAFFIWKVGNKVDQRDLSHYFYFIWLTLSKACARSAMRCDNVSLWSFVELSSTSSWNLRVRNLWNASMIHSSSWKETQYVRLSLLANNNLHSLFKSKLTDSIYTQLQIIWHLKSMIYELWDPLVS